MIGPSYVGKTQLVNRLTNNSFTGYYEPTIKPLENRIAYNLYNDELYMDPHFFDLEIIDMFPHDHPYLDEEKLLMADAATEMNDKLEEVVRSPFTIENQVTKEPIPMIDRIHGYIFVYDSSNKRTFTSMMCMLETINDLEASNRKREGDNAKNSKIFYPKKIVVGNKKDLRRNKEAGIIGESDINQLEKNIRIKEVSALTNFGIQEVLKLLVTDMNNDKSFDK